MSKSWRRVRTLAIRKGIKNAPVIFAMLIPMRVCNTTKGHKLHAAKCKSENYMFFTFLNAIVWVLWYYVYIGNQPLYFTREAL